MLRSGTGATSRASLMTALCRRAHVGDHGAGAGGRNPGRPARAGWLPPTKPIGIMPAAVAAADAGHGILDHDAIGRIDLQRAQRAGKGPGRVCLSGTWSRRKSDSRKS